MVCESGPRLAPVFGWGEHGAEKEHETVRILVVLTTSLGDKALRRTADFAHPIAAFGGKTIRPGHAQLHFQILDIRQ